MKTTACVAGLMAVSLGFTVAPAAVAQTIVTVNQGDTIYFDRDGEWKTCTVGFVTPRASTGLTAGHCGSEGETVYVSSGGRYVEAGTLHPATNFRMTADGGRVMNDQATINFSDRILIGRNIYSGDTVVDPSAVTMGDQACFHGSATHGGTVKYRCGQFMDLIREVAYIQVENTFGDSGAPVWVPGKGFLGVLSLNGSYREPFYDDASTPLTVATVGTNGTQLVTDAEQSDLLVRYSDFLAATEGAGAQMTEHELYEGDPGAVTPADGAGSGSSNPATTRATGIAFGVVIGLIALIAAIVPHAGALNGMFNLR